MRERSYLLPGTISDFQKIIGNNLNLWFSRIKSKKSSLLDILSCEHSTGRQTITFQCVKTFDTYIWLELEFNFLVIPCLRCAPNMVCPCQLSLLSGGDTNLRHPDCTDSPLRLFNAPVFPSPTSQWQVWRREIVWVGMILLVSLMTTPVGSLEAIVVR